MGTTEKAELNARWIDMALRFLADMTEGKWVAYGGALAAHLVFRVGEVYDVLELGVGVTDTVGINDAARLIANRVY